MACSGPRYKNFTGYYINIEYENKRFLMMMFVFIPASESELPERKEHRVALVEDASGILLRIGLDSSKSQDIEVRLLIGAAVSSWSTTADYPRRVPLHHCDALLHYTATQSVSSFLNLYEFPNSS